MSATRYLDPKNDLAFKRIFGTEKNKDILIHFLNDIFGRTTNPIEDVTFLKQALEPEIVASRTSIVDLMCKDTEGNRFIVEMQIADEPGFEKRAQYYAARAYIQQRDKDTNYRDLKEVTFLAITNFVIFPNHARYLSHHCTTDSFSKEPSLKDFSFSFLELPKFNKSVDELHSVVEKWAYFFKEAPETTQEDLAKIIKNDQIIERAFNELSQYAWTEEELLNYEAVDMKQSADRAILEGAHEAGKLEGILEGKIEVAKTMLNQKYDMSIISAVTGLSAEEIKKIS